MSFNSRSKTVRLGDSGFTLLEVMISLVILVFIAFGIYQATTETFKLRDVLTVEGDFYNGIRLSMGILQKDVALMYSPALMVPPKPPNAQPNLQEQQMLQSGDLAQSTPFWSGALDLTGIRPSRFQGTQTSMSFVAVSHSRIYKNSPESDFAKITYELRKDEGNKDFPEARVLTKIENSDAFNLEDRKDSPHIHVYPILHGIKTISFKYYRRDASNTMVAQTSWDSDNSDYKNQYPEIVEINFEVQGPQKLSFEGTYRFRPEIPLRGLNPST